MSVRERATSGAYAAGWHAVRRLPQTPARLLFDRGADLGYARGGKGARRLKANLARVVAATPALTGTDLDVLGAAAMRSYARYWREVFQLPNISPERIAAQTAVIGFEHIERAQAAGRGTILALPHMGNWDAAGAWLVGHGYPFTTVAERLEPAGLFDRFVAFRSSLGMEVIALTGGTQPPFALLRDRLEAGGVLCLLADRDLTPAGVPVELFGSTATVPAGPAALAERTGAALLPVTLCFDSAAPWELTVHPPVLGDVATASQAMVDAFAVGISAHPADWHMLQRLWREDLVPR